MLTVLITGANRGIGLELANQYLMEGYRVIACCRNPRDANELLALADKGSLAIHSLDVTDSESIRLLVKQIENNSIDIVINNAGVYGPKPCLLGEVDESEWLDVFKVNAIAPLKLTEALREKMRENGLKKMAFLSSQMGSIADNSSGGSYIYRSSKAALNAVIKSLSIDLEKDGIKVVALHPGWVKTSMGGANALIEAEESARGLRRIIGDLKQENSGAFLRFDGGEIPW